MKKTVSLHFMNEPEDPYRIALSLAKSKSRVVTRLTGGCGSLSEDAAKGMTELLSDAFLGYSGIFLFGGTRMVRKDDESIIVPGITEVASLIKRNNKHATVLGVIPRTEELIIRHDGTLIVSNEDESKPYITIVHPDQDSCIVVQANVNKESIWLAEANVCLKLTDLMRAIDGWRSLLVSYAGGSVTRQEIEKTARMKWPVLLIKGGGGSTDELAHDSEFRRVYPNVYSVEKEIFAIRETLKKLGALGKKAGNSYAREKRGKFRMLKGGN